MAPTTTVGPQLLGGFQPTPWCQSIGGLRHENTANRADSHFCVFDDGAGAERSEPMDQNAACRWAYNDPQAFIVYPDGPGGNAESPKCWTQP